MSIQSTTLENGLRVISDTIPTVETVSLGVWLNVGTRHETKTVNGVSHVLEHMAFKGTEQRTAAQIAEEIESVGGYLNAYTARETTAYYARVLKQDVPLATEILADILQNSIFDEDEFKREQAVILQEIGQANDTPDDIIFDYFQETCYPNQPMGWPVLGQDAIVQSLTAQTVKQYMHTHYAADKMVFAAAGHVDHQELVKRVSKHFCAFPSFSSEQKKVSADYQGGDFRQHKDLEQVHLILGFEGVPYKHPDFYVLSVLSMILGGGMSSRLFQEVREKRGLVYTIYASTASYTDSGLFHIYAGTGRDEVKELVPVMCEQLRTFNQTLTLPELDRAKAQLKASLLMGLESTSNRCERLAHQVLIYGQPVSTEQIVQSIDAVQTEDIKRVASSLFRSRPTLTTLGPVQQVMPFDQVCEQLTC